MFGITGFNSEDSPGLGSSKTSTATETVPVGVVSLFGQNFVGFRTRIGTVQFVGLPEIAPKSSLIRVAVRKALMSRLGESKIFRVFVLSRGVPGEMYRYYCSLVTPTLHQGKELL